MKGDRDLCVQPSSRDQASEPARETAAVFTTAKRARGKTEFLRELAHVFLEELPRMLAAVRTAVEDNEHARLQRAAHELKGSAANFDATPTVQAAFELERAASEGDRRRIDAGVARLERCVADLAAALRRLEESET